MQYSTDLSQFPLMVSYGRLTGVLSVLFLLSILYAVVLNAIERRWNFVSDYTWVAVVVGVGYTLAGLAILNWQAALLALVVFAISGVPIIGRSILNESRERNEYREYLKHQGNDDDRAA